MQKEIKCKICGAYFYSEAHNRKYCDDCAAHTRTRKEQYAKAAQRSYWRSYYEDVHTYTCKQCGKNFRMPPYLVEREFVTYVGNNRLVFCSKRCLHEWDEEEKARLENQAYEEIERWIANERKHRGK